MSRADVDTAMLAFAAAVGAEDPVCVRGGGTRWNLGGVVAPGTSEVAAPVGIVALEDRKSVV